MAPPSARPPLCRWRGCGVAVTLQRKTPLKRSTKRIRKMRARYTPEFWKGQREKVRSIQGGRCAFCDKPGTLDAAHIRGLGRTGTRNDPKNPLNQLSNLLGLDRECHETFDAEPLSTRLIVGAELKKKFDWPPDW